MSYSGDPVITSIAFISEGGDRFDVQELYDLQQDLWQKKPARAKRPGMSLAARASLREKFRHELGFAAQLRRYVFECVQDTYNLIGYLFAFDKKSSWLAYALLGRA